MSFQMIAFMRTKKYAFYNFFFTSQEDKDSWVSIKGKESAFIVLRTHDYKVQPDEGLLTKAN